MLLLDNFKEIAYRTDYFTTISLLAVMPILNTDQFWEDKWHVMYNRSSLPFFTDQDNFLMMERSMVLIFDSYFKLHKNILFENHQLQEKLELYSKNYLDLFYIPIDVKKQFIIIKHYNLKTYVDNQFDDYQEAEDYIEKDVIKITNVNLYVHASYYIVDMDKIVICFNNVNLQRKPNHQYNSARYDSIGFKRL